MLMKLEGLENMEIYIYITLRMRRGTRNLGNDFLIKKGNLLIDIDIYRMTKTTASL